MTDINPSGPRRLHDELLQRELSRRVLLRNAAGGALGLTAAGWLLGCGSDSGSGTTASADSGDVSTIRTVSRRCRWSESASGPKVSRAKRAADSWSSASGNAPSPAAMKVRSS